MAHFFQTYPRVIKPLRNLTLLLVVTGAPYMTQLACSKFVGLQTFGSFKGGRKVTFFGNFAIRIIKFSKNISWVSFFLFHTNVVKHEKEGQ